MPVGEKRGAAVLSDSADPALEEGVVGGRRRAEDDLWTVALELHRRNVGRAGRERSESHVELDGDFVGDGEGLAQARDASAVRVQRSRRRLRRIGLVREPAVGIDSAPTVADARVAALVEVLAERGVDPLAVTSIGDACIACFGARVLVGSGIAAACIHVGRDVVVGAEE